jgi:cell division protein FtsI/penicillin-binding protein 2
MVLEAPLSDKRFRILLYIFVCWASVITVRLFYFSIINRESAFNKMEIESLEKGRVRAMRGRILSHDGKVLVSSRRVSNLCLKTNIDSDQLNGLVEILDKELKIMRRQVMVKLANCGNKKFISLKRDLSTKQIDDFSKLFLRNSTIFIKMEFKRGPNNDPRIGEVALKDGVYVGTSGYEKKYDKLLRGQDLIYEVMVDKQNKVIDKTFNEISKMIPGQDVYLTKEEWP